MQAPTLHEIESALSFISPNIAREEWARVAMALKSELGDLGSGLFHGWSAGSDSYKHAEAESTWRSVKGSGGITIATLFAMAKDAGYVPSVREPSEEDRKRQKEEYAARVKAREISEERERAHIKKWRDVVAAAACDLWGRLSDTGTSPYLDRKQVRAFGVKFPPFPLLLRLCEDEYFYSVESNPVEIAGFFTNKTDDDKFRYLNRGSFVVPVYASDGALVNLQIIHKAGGKSFLPGAKSGCWAPLVPPVDGEPILVGEGYATVISGHMATGFAAVAAFDAGNLHKVAASLRAYCPTSKIIILGDDDVSTEGNPGRVEAMRARDVCGGAVVFPVFDGGESNAA